MSYNDIKKQSFDYALIAMAYHESGHAVIALYNYFYVSDINAMRMGMVPKNLEEGEINYNIYKEELIDDKELKKIFLIFELQLLYAGLMSEKIYYKDVCGSSKFPMHLRIGSNYDFNLASKIIRKNKLAEPGKNTFLFKKQVQFDVEQIITNYWDDIKIVSHALYKKKKLTFDELKFILSRKSINKDFWRDRFKKIAVIHNDNKITAEDVVKDLVLDDAIFSI